MEIGEVKRARGASLIYVLIILSIILSFTTGFVYYIHERWKISSLKGNADRSKGISVKYLSNMEEGNSRRLFNKGLEINGKNERLNSRSDYFGKKFIVESSGDNTIKRLVYLNEGEESIGGFKIREIRDYDGNIYSLPLSENMVYRRLKVVYFKKVMGKEVIYWEEMDFKRLDPVTVEITEVKIGMVSER